MRVGNVPLVFGIFVLGVLVKVTIGTSSQNPTTNLPINVQVTTGHIVNLTRDSFNVSVANRSHFVMFFNST